MNDKEKTFLKNQLDIIYSLLNSLENTRIKGTKEYKIQYELENINMRLDIPFND